VMDLGTGTGILAFFAAEAGARVVYAVEASNLADYTELVVSSNGKKDKIKVLKGRIEELKLPEKVDIILSEWMGTFLIFESMMESLLWARDHWLKPDGVLFPSHGSIYLAPVCIDQLYGEKVEFWKNVYDVDMSVLIPFAKRCAFEKPIIDKPVTGDAVLATPILIRSFDLKTVPMTQPYDKTVVPFFFKATRTGKMHGFVAWFDVLFKNGENDPNVVTLSTSPNHKDTHWHQDLFIMDEPIEIQEGHTIKGIIRYQRNPELLRHLIIDISVVFVELHKTMSKKFYLWGVDSAY